MNKLLSQEQVAQHFGVSTRTLYNWRKAGKAPFLVEIRGHFYADPEDVRAYLISLTRSQWGC